MSSVLVNGEERDSVSADDRGLCYGDGLFETIACRAGRPRHLDLHLGRLARGCRQLAIPMPDAGLLEAEIVQLLAGTPRAIARLVLTRGRAVLRGYRPSGDELPTRVVSVHAWPAPIEQPFRAGLARVHPTAPMRLGSQPLLAGLKHLNRLEQVLAQQAAARAGVHEVVLLDARGEIACGSMTNIYLRIDGQWMTPPLADCGVAGVTRERLLAGAGGPGFSPRVRPLAAPCLESAEAMAFSNVRLGLQAVHWYEGRELWVDPQLAHVQESLDGD